jgi:chromosome segregation ATPase
MNLEWNCCGIWESGFRNLCDSLPITRSLESLDLRNNKIGPQSSAYLANSLRANNTIKYIDFRWNHAGIIGGRAIAEMLKYNKSLQKFELAGNEVQEDILANIEMGLNRNRRENQSSAETRNNNNLLHATIQEINNSHQKSLAELEAALLKKQVETQQLSNQLGKAGQEMDDTLLSYKVIEKRLKEEIERKERLEKKLLDIDEVLSAERKENSERFKGMMHDLMIEREHRIRDEESAQKAFNQLTEKLLNTESSLKNMSLQAMSSEKDMDELKKDLQRYKNKVKSLEVQMEDQESQHKKELAAIEEKHQKALHNEKKKLKEVISYCANVGPRKYRNIANPMEFQIQ